MPKCLENIFLTTENLKWLNEDYKLGKRNLNILRGQKDGGSGNTK